MKKIIGLLIFSGISFFYTGTVFSSENYSGDFLTLGAGARTLGMGGSSVVNVKGAVSSYYNPASLSTLKSSELNLMHSEQFAGLINYNTISVGTPVSDDLFMGATLIHSGIGDIKYTRLWDPSQPIGEDNRPEIASKVDATDYSLFLSSSKKFRENLSLGASVKIIRRSIGDDTAFGYGLDLGILWGITENWTLGAAVRDLTGTTVAWDGKSNDIIPVSTDAGAAYSSEMPWFGGRYSIAATMHFLGDYNDVQGINTMNIGMEYLINNLIALRIGSDRGTATFGLGLSRLPLISSTSIDYAFLSDDGLDSTHRISMSVNF
jgi:hypothetical protein